jgi:chemotaxis protein MotB
MAGEDRPRVIIVRKKGGHGGGHHGGAWKVAYADFVTAMMALFMVLWLLTQADLQLRQQIAQYFRSPGIMPGATVLTNEVNEFKSREPQVVAKDIIIVQGSSAQQELLEGRVTAEAEQHALEAQAKELEAAVHRAVAEDPDLAPLKDQVIIQVNDAGLSIEVVDKGGSFLFDVNSAELKPPLEQILRRMGPILAKLDNPIQVGGHTDSRPFPAGSAKSNWELSFERANNARRILEGAGLRPGQINRVLAYADSAPLVAHDPLADENRRLSLLAERKAPPPSQVGKGGTGAVVLPPDSLPVPPAGAPG